MKDIDDNKEEILEIPDIPDGIIQAFNNRSLIIFVGAGASAQVGMPLWNELADNLLDACFKQGYIDDGERDLLKNKLTDNKEKISVVAKHFEQHGEKPAFFDLVKDALEPDDDYEDKASIYDFCVLTNARVVTTNADTLIDEYFEPSLIGYEIGDMEKLLQKQPALLKIHGTVENDDSLVLTTKDYIDKYRSEDFKILLEKIFDEKYTVLFLGYGLGEFELLDFVLEKTDNPKNIYIVNDYYSHEISIKKAKDLYYESIGVHQISYCKDKKGYEQLNDVLAEWGDNIKSETDLPATTLELIREAVEHENKDVLLQCVNGDRVAKRFLFEEIIRQDKFKSLFPILLNDGFLEVDNLDDSSLELKYINDNYNRIIKLFPGLKTEIDTMIKNTVIRLVENGYSEPQRFNVFQISEIIVKNDNNILEEELEDYLNLYKEYYGGISGFLYRSCGEHSRVKEWKKEDIILLFSLLLCEKVGNNMHYKWQECRFLELFQDIFVEIYYKDIFVMILDWMKNNAIEINYLSLEVGAIVNIHNNSVKLNNKGKWLLKYLAEMVKNKPKIAEQVMQLEESDGGFGVIIKRLQIYAIASHYELLKDYLFNRGDNPFDNWELYDDLFYLVEANIMIIDEKEADTLCEWIEKTRFGKDDATEEYVKVLKYDLMTLLSKRWEKFLGKATSYFSDEHDSFPRVYERNKGFTFSVENIESSKKLIDELMKRDFEDSIALINNYEELKEYESSKYKIGVTINNYFSKINLREHDLFETITKIPKEYRRGFTNAVSQSMTNETLSKDYDFYKMIIEMCESGDTDDDKELIVDVCRYVSSPNIQVEGKENAQKICGTITDILFNQKVVAVYDECVSDIEDPVHRCINNIYVTGISTILDCIKETDEEFRQRVSDKIKKLLEQKEDEDCRFSFTWNFDRLFLIDNKWTMNQIDRLVKTDDDYVIIVYHSVLTKELYDIVKTKELFDILINYSDDYHGSLIEKVMALSTYMSLSQEKLDQFGVEWLKKGKVKSIKGSLGIIDQLLGVEGKKKSAEKLLKDLAVNSDNVEIEEDDELYESVRILSDCFLKIEKVNTDEFKLLKRLLEKKRYSIPKRLFVFMKEKYDEYKKDICETICIILDCADSGAIVYNDDLFEVIDIIENDIESKNEFYKINSKLISMNIFRYVRERKKDVDEHISEDEDTVNESEDDEDSIKEENNDENE